MIQTTYLGFILISSDLKKTFRQNDSLPLPWNKSVPELVSYRIKCTSKCRDKLKATGTVVRSYWCYITLLMIDVVDVIDVVLML